MIQPAPPTSTYENWLAAMGLIGLVTVCFLVSYQCSRESQPVAAPALFDAAALPADITATVLPAAVSPADAPSPVTP